MVDSARRSRIRQLDRNVSQTQEDQMKVDMMVANDGGVNAHDSLKLAAIQSNGPPSRLNQKVM